jgi:hypothetical protein
MALLFHPFVSMLQPRAHELARVNEEYPRKMKNEPPTMNNPQTSHMRVYIITRTKNHMASPRSSCNHFSQLKPKWVNKI